MWYSLTGLTLGRLAAIPLALAQWVVVYWFASRFGKRPQSTRRVIAWFITFAWAMATPFVQMILFKQLAMTAKAVDPYLVAILISESIVCTALMFVGLASKAAKA